MIKRRWRNYRTSVGRRVVDEFFDSLSKYDASRVAAAMRDVREDGLAVARHLRGEIYEVRANGADRSYRLLFATEGRKSRVLLALVVVVKNSQKTPHRDIRLADQRLDDWRWRGKMRRRTLS